MNISKISFIVTALAVLLASANVIIRAVSNKSMTSALIILGAMVAVFIFSVIVTGGNKNDAEKKTEPTDKNEQ